MKKILIFSLVCMPLFFAAQEMLDNIVITSERAKIKQGDDKDKTTSIAYEDNVVVKIGAEGKIMSQKLEVIMAKKASSNEKVPENALPIDFKQVLLTGGVRLEYTNRSAQADRAELYPLSKECKLIGNVKLEQKKETDNDIPIISTCDEAIVKLDSKEVIFQSTLPSLVSTTITLSGYSRLTKKVKTKEEKAREKKEKLALAKQQKTAT